MAIKENVNINTKTSEKRGISKFFRELKAEVKRITWPSKDDTKKALIAVGVVVLIYIILVGGLDYIFTNLFKLIFKLSCRRFRWDFSSIVNMSERARWYVVHTYSGYENKVKANLEKTIENRNLEHLLLDIQVPMEEVVEEKDGKQKVSLKKKFPGYVLVKMLMTDESWYVVRNTRGVTGFVGPGSKPVPLTEEEVESMGVVEISVDIDLEVGESVRVISGPLREFVAIIQEISVEKHKIKALIDMFGRETLAELDFNQVEKLV